MAFVILTALLAEFCMYERSWFTVDFLETLTVFLTLADTFTFFLPVVAGVFLGEGIVV